MPLLCWIGNPYFAAGLADHGWTVRLIERRSPVITTWDDVLAACGGAPDAVVLADASLPPILAGVERWPCLTAAHFVDTHIHSWHPLYAQAFDLASVSLRDDLDRFRGQRLDDARLLWLPPWAPDTLRPRDTQKDWDLLFAGTVDPETTPGRHEFLRRLADRLPGLHVTSGDFGALFPRARVVLNYCERGDLNFRVFEALGCGACLLTPAVGHGQDALFPPGEALYTYPIHGAEADLDALPATATALLADPAARARAGAAGLARVDAAHRARHRCRDYAAFLAAHDAPALIRARLGAAPALHRDVLRLLYLHFAETTPAPELRAAFLRMATGAPGPAPGG